MKPIVGAAMGAALITGLAVAGSQPASAQDDQSFILATAGTGGTYYPVGVAIATLISVRVEPQHGIGMSAITSAGSGENIRLLREDEVQFAILQGLFGAYAAAGEGPIAEDGPQEHLRSVSMLWPNVEHFAIRSSFVDTGTIADFVAMEGESFAIGARNSGTEGSNRYLIEQLGIADPDSYYNLAFMGYAPSVDAFQNGELNAVNIAAGPPVGAYTQLAAAVGDEVVLLGWTPEQVAEVNQIYDGLYYEYVIPADTYPNLSADVTTVAQPNFLAVRADVDEEAVYLITRAMYENLPFLQNIHPATDAMSLDSAISGLPLPLHPGAIRYYEEAGLTIPDRLRP
ncbi:MAG: TAXI family TRAP transporter solute-binding subunit [Azospirillaceae bacterium]